MSDTSQGEGWWLASDGKWYPPQAAHATGNQKVLFRNSQYLGGLPGTRRENGNLHVSDAGVGVGGAVAKKGLIGWSHMASISFDSGTAAKSRVGATLAFGVLGALASQGAQDVATITINLKDGNAAFYRVEGKSGPMVRASFQPFLVAYSIPCLDDPAAGSAPPQGVSAAPPPATATPSVSPIGRADELAKLAGLRDQGVISEEEFQSMKQQLLAHGVSSNDATATSSEASSADVPQQPSAAPPPPPPAVAEEDSWRNQLRQEMQAQKEDGTSALLRQVPSPFGPRARKERKERRAEEARVRAAEAWRKHQEEGK